MSIKFTPSKSIATILLILSALVIGWLFHHYIYPGPFKPYIGTCENTDVGVTVGNPSQYMLTTAGMMERDYSTARFAADRLVLVDSFDYASTRLILQKRDGRCCYDFFQAVERSDPRVVIRTYDVSEFEYIVTIDHAYWKIYKPHTPETL